MADPLLVTVLAFFHIFFAMLWLGGSFIFAFALGPIVQSFSPQAQREFYIKSVSVNRYFRIVTSLTVLFGFLLLYVFVNGDFSMLTTTAWGQKILVGMTLGFAAFLLTNLYTAPHLDRAASLMRETADSATLPPPEFLKLSRAGVISAGITLFLVLITLIFMVSAGFY